MELNKEKIIELYNNERFLVIDKVISNNKDYYYIAQINEEENDIIDNYKIVTLETENEETYIEEVLGEEKLKEILPLFLENNK